ncbi:23S rRNA (uracil(1939)-C(5))-methyltransferase RlmD [Thermococcus sp. MAR1]|uniref:23S rRNA (uracil(1939)-C(5))-methyltransferase RlmD n=1 Tax=Thermococcus sp. MAR1 TaxID=1638263 RepID=UPI00143BBEB8|nr:23S rRNA (uracil(1939)-C(5))-methyltransferase RlmD [Thermococcus sp. MAR1]NJE11291.1 23S rRNA (uracil(1939)-C(5))-methyltransferase RlmD [Thermococcus sp. MAR1]
MRGVVERLDMEGLGVVGLGKKEIHIPFTTPGDVVEVRRWRRRKRTLIATDFEVVEPSQNRVDPKCPHFGTCGGCLLQHIPYEEQVRFKSDKLSRILGFDVEVLPSSVIYGHRNRIDVVISTNGIGFRRRGTWWDAVDIEWCPVFGESSRRVLRSLREFVEDFRLSLYEIRKNEGFLRYIVIREGKFTGELMVNLVTSPGKLPPEFPEYFNYATSVYWSVNRTQSDVSYGEIERFWGSEFIRERLDDVTYLIHPNSFFQTNSYAAVTLVRKVAELVDGGRVLDLYSGVGTFGIYLAKRGFEVEGIEANPFAVEMANRNVELNGVDATFSVGEDKNVENLSEYETIIVDPPRAGLHPKLIKKILKDKPQSIVYVSCNPKTLRANLDELEGVYSPETAVGIDMFPHTPHVETVVKLKLKV